MSRLLFLETPGFQKWVKKNRLTAEVRRLKEDLSASPDDGEVIPDGGGLRKIRMAGAGRGKRGGFRVIYVLMVRRTVAVMIDGYSKSEKEDLSADEVAALSARANAIRPIAERYAAENAPEVKSDAEGES